MIYRKLRTNLGKCRVAIPVGRPTQPPRTVVQPYFPDGAINTEVGKNCPVSCPSGHHETNVLIFGPILWGHSGPLCHALSLLLSLSSWTSMRRWRETATPGEWQCKTARSGEWAQHFLKCFLFFLVYIMLHLRINEISHDEISKQD